MLLAYFTKKCFAHQVKLYALCGALRQIWDISAFFEEYGVVNHRFPLRNQRMTANSANGIFHKQMPLVD